MKALRMAAWGARSGYAGLDPTTFNDFSDLGAIEKAAVRLGRVGGIAGRRIANVYSTPVGRAALNVAMIGTPAIGVGMMLSGNGQQEPDMGTPPPTNLGNGVVDPSMVVSTLGYLPDEKAVERELNRLRNQQVYNGLTIQALEYAERNRQFLEQARAGLRAGTPMSTPVTPGETGYPVSY